jgi:hypothetical protein
MVMQPSICTRWQVLFHDRSFFKFNVLTSIKGHGYGIDDFYTYTPPGQTNFIMKAGSSPYITEFDAWMVRDWYRHLKSSGVIQPPGGGGIGKASGGGMPMGAKGPGGKPSPTLPT